MHRAGELLIFLAAICAAAPVSAELYKWVDERGVTNYSSEPPPAAATAKKLTRIDSRISVYTPDESVMRGVVALRERNIRALSEPEPERSPVARIAVPPQSGYEKCVLSGRLGCDDLWGNPHTAYLPVYLPVAGILPAYGVRPTRFLEPRPPASRPAPTRVSRVPAVR